MNSAMTPFPLHQCTLGLHLKASLMLSQAVACLVQIIVVK